LAADRFINPTYFERFYSTISKQPLEVFNDIYMVSSNYMSIIRQHPYYDMDDYWLSRNYEYLITKNTVQNKLAYKNGPRLMNVLHL